MQEFDLRYEEGPGKWKNVFVEVSDNCEKLFFDSTARYDEGLGQGTPFSNREKGIGSHVSGPIAADPECPGRLLSLPNPKTRAQGLQF